MRQVVILSVLLLAALTASYLSWTAEEADTSKAEQVMIYRAAADEIESVTWTQDALVVLLERRSDPKGDYVWVTVTETTTTDAVEPEGDTDVPMGPDETTPDAPPAPEPTEVTETVSFKGNDAAEKAWADFAPLYALRELHPDTTVSDEAFGFDNPSGTLRVNRRSGPLELVLGGESYGAKDRYVKVDDRIFLVDDKTLRPLQYAKTRLVDRLLQPVQDREADRMDVTWAGRTISLVQKNKDDRAAAFWARADAETEEMPAAETWLGKVMRLRIQDYAVSDDASAMEPVFSFVVTGGKNTWKVEILELPTAQGDEYYAHSDYARGTVHLTESLASEAIADLETIFPAE